LTEKEENIKIKKMGQEGCPERKFGRMTGRKPRQPD